MKNPKFQLTWTSVIYGITVFAGAFLLFQVQPLMGRFLLPWFGGSPEVWTTCMLFFQLFLLGGYAYAHGLSRLSLRVQAVIHLGLVIIAAVMAFQVIPGSSFKPSPEDNPILKILLICAVCIGLPYFMLSTTGPLMQAWISRLNKGSIPYRLYALSNAGSLLALLSFPFVFEPLLSRRQLAAFWSGGFVLFAVVCTLCAIFLFRKGAKTQTADLPDADLTQPEAVPGWRTWLLWLALPMGASVELLAVTNKITQDIAVIPFLWILPLSLYLLSFIICFDHQRWYVRPLFLSLFILGIIGVIAARNLEETPFDIRMLIALYAFMLFCCCMVCHGELYALRPHPKYLTGFYLMVAAGGALGGFFVAVIAPLIFKTYIELHLGLLACVIFIVMADQKYIRNPRKKAIYVVILLIVGLIGILFMGKRTKHNQRAIARSRNFFGVLTVWEDDWNDPQKHKWLLQHGTTYHGLQFQSPELRHIPTAYYGFSSGIGLYIQATPGQKNRRIGVVGLGVGTIAFYGKAGDTVRFYEINPEVERLAKEYFTYLSDSEADIEIILGDARLSLENEPPQNYDILVLDAFSSDAVPLHLLTNEALEIYLKHLAPDGVLAFHISTLHLDLQSVLWKLADHLNLHALWFETYDDPAVGALSSDWILLSRTDTVYQKPVLRTSASEPYGNPETLDLWTDDHINLLQILKKTPIQ